jgi:hypothetical protein
MRRWIVVLLCLSSVAALGADAGLREIAFARLREVGAPLFEHGAATEPRFDRFYSGMVEALPPQQRAERALELAINNYDGAADYVMASAPSWRGQIRQSASLTTLMGVAINAPRIEVRMAAYELQLAQYGLEKSVAEADRLLARLREDPRGAGPWALWTLGALGARGVDRPRILAELTLAARIDDDELRRWAVDAIGRFGGEEVVAPLLDIAANDRTPAVRERAFCALAQSGTLHIAERYAAIPGLLAIAEDPRSEPQNRAWSYQALREISGRYDVPEDALAWRRALGEVGLLR